MAPPAEETVMELQQRSDLATWRKHYHHVHPGAIEDALVFTSVKTDLGVVASHSSCAQQMDANKDCDAHAAMQLAMGIASSSSAGLKDAALQTQTTSSLLPVGPSHTAARHPIHGMPPRRPPRERRQQGQRVQLLSQSFHAMTMLKAASANMVLQVQMLRTRISIEKHGGNKSAVPVLKRGDVGKLTVKQVLSRLSCRSS